MFSGINLEGFEKITLANGECVSDAGKLKMNRDIFKPSDFDPKTELADDGQELCSYQWASRKANEKLNKLIESWPIVRGYKSASDGLMYWHEHLMNDTHTARLAFIEEIKKEPCQHQPHSFDMKEGWHCTYCLVDLEPIWVEKK